jgi:hypothetical protein
MDRWADKWRIASITVGFCGLELLLWNQQQHGRRVSAVDTIVILLVLIYNIMKVLIFILLMLIIPALSFGRLTEVWSYDRMSERASLIVIAKPLSTVEISNDDKLPGGLDYNVVGLLTTFQVKTVLKGDKTLKEFTMHYYRLKTPQESKTDRPNFVSFDLKHPQTYLFFLGNDTNNNYSPVTGQVDPAQLSVIELNGFAL